MKFTKIPFDAFQKLQINAGILTTDFTPATGTIGEAGQIGATTGGVNFTATPTYSDFGEDIDNCPKNMKELKKLDSWEVKMTGTFVNADTAIAKRLCGAADIGTTDATKVTPRNDLKDADLMISGLWAITPTRTAKPTAALSPSSCSTRFPRAASSFRRRTSPRASLRSSLPATIP